MSAEATTRTRVLRAAAQLFQRQGFHATGLKQILDESHAPRGSLYFHFPGGKEQLAVEAVRNEGARVGRAIEHTLAAHADPREAIPAFVRAFAHVLQKSDYAEGCPVATVTLEAAATSGPIRAACADSYDDWERQIREHLVGAGLSPARAERLATLVLAAVEGGLILSRARRDTAPFDVVADELAALIHAAITGPRKRFRRTSKRATQL